jgi:hypothetical protein
MAKSRYSRWLPVLASAVEKWAPILPRLCASLEDPKRVCFFDVIGFIPNLPFAEAEQVHHRL